MKEAGAAAHAAAPRIGVVKAWAAAHRDIILVAAIAATLLVLIFARLMNYDLRRDEQLYVTPAALLRDFDLYKDFFYNHTPLSAWMFRAAKLLTGSESLLFPARLVLFGAWIFFAAAVAAISFRLTRSAAMTAFLLIAAMTNDVFLSVTGMAATNNFLPLPLLYVGLGLFFIGLERLKPSPWLFLAAGAALGCAASIKISAAIAGPLVFAAALFLPRRLSLRARVREVAAPIAFGGIIGAAPALTYLINIPDTFLAHVIGWHAGPHRDFWATLPAEPLEAAMTLPGKAQLAFVVWTTGANAILIAAALTLIFSAPRSVGARRGEVDGRAAAAGAVAAALAAASFLPTPSFPQYFAPPVAVAPLLIALLYSRLPAAGRRRIAPAVAALSIVLLLINLPRLGMDLPRLASPDRWEVAKVHRDGLAIRNAMDAAGVMGKVATLAPVYPLEADLPVYNALATGPFAYRSAPHTRQDLARHLVMIAPDTVEAMLEAEPPAAMLLGFMPELEAPLLRFAARRGFRAVEGFAIQNRDGVLRLYLPDSASGAGVTLSAPGTAP